MPQKMAHPSLTAPRLIDGKVNHLCETCTEWTPEDRLFVCPECKTKWAICQPCGKTERCLNCPKERTLTEILADMATELGPSNTIRITDKKTGLPLVIKTRPPLISATSMSSLVGMDVHRPSDLVEFNFKKHTGRGKPTPDDEELDSTGPLDDSCKPGFVLID
jgi:hypothetical protein